MSRDPYSPPAAGVDDHVAAAPLRWSRVAGAAVGIWLITAVTAIVVGFTMLINDGASTWEQTALLRHPVVGVVAFVGYLYFLRGIPERPVLHVAVVYAAIETLELVVSVYGFDKGVPGLSAFVIDAVPAMLALAWRSRTPPPA